MAAFKSLLGLQFRLLDRDVASCLEDELKLLCLV